LRPWCLTAPNVFAAWDEAGHRCLHSKAAEVLHSHSEDTALEILPEEALLEHIPSQVDLETEEVFIVNPSPGQDFMLSIACGNSGFERIFVGANNCNEFRCHFCRSFDCQHCTTVQRWVQTQDGAAMELSEVFDSFSLRGADQQSVGQPQQPSCLPISYVKVPPSFASELLATRAFGEGKCHSLNPLPLHRHCRRQQASIERALWLCRQILP
jgi:hypothetical protein